MRKYTFIGLSLLFLISCEERNQTIFLHLLTTEKVEKTTLTVEEKTDVINYQYIHQTDAIKNLDLIYQPKEDILILKKDTFLSTSKKYITKNFNFRMYQKDEIKSYNRTLVFHKKYGLLCSTGYGADFLFFKDSLQLPETKMIFKEIILELNKIDK